MRNTILLTMLAIGVSGCAATGSMPTGKPSVPNSAGDRQAVIVVAERLFSAMKSRDTTTLRQMLAPELVLISVRSGGPAPAVTRRTTVSEFVTSIAQSQEEMVERMWNPKVEVHGDLASLWAPYDFHIGGRFSHCGTDALQLVRSNGNWQVVGLSYTVQTAGCSAPSG